MSDLRTPLDIEADIVRRRQELAVALDEIAVRVHPRTIMGDAKARVSASVDRTLGRAYVTANGAVSDVRAKFVDENGAARMDRVVPVAAVAVAAVGGVALLRSRRRRH